jgi:hypothetical protein
MPTTLTGQLILGTDKDNPLLLIGICFFDVTGVCLTGVFLSRRNGAEMSPAACLVGLRGLVGGRPPAPEGGRGLQEGPSGGYCSWKRRSCRSSRVQFTAERLPRRARGATAPPVPLALSLSP